MLRRIRSLVLLTVPFLLIAGPASACGGLISSNGTVQLVDTTTMAAYHHGVEHYVTAFKFVGPGAAFGSIVPLPDVPTKVIKAGRWTLQRLEIEVSPPRFEAVALDSGAAASGKAQVILTAKVDALDITVLKGGGAAVGTWARQHGFELTPDAPQVLDFYAKRSPIFAAVKFDAARARQQGVNIGDGTPVHFVIPTDRPWVPLRILALGAKGVQPIEADVFLLTGKRPSLLPVPDGDASPGPVASGLSVKKSEPASRLLLGDLRSDRGMGWLPSSGMWLTFLRLDAKAANLTYDLAIDPTGQGHTSVVDAGLAAPTTSTSGSSSPVWPLVLIATLGAAALVAVAKGRGRARPAL
jgi:hypothetical protein